MGRLASCRCWSRRWRAAAARACASCARRDELAESLEGRAQRGRCGLRRRPAARRALDRAPAAHRGAGAGRRARLGAPPRRARVQPAAAPPEGDRGGALAGGRPRAARAARGGRGRAGAELRLHERRHGRVHHRGGRPVPVLLPRDERPPAGRAPGDRGGHRGSTSSSCSCAWRRASRCRSARPTSGCDGHAIEARIYAEDPRGVPALERADRRLAYRRRGARRQRRRGGRGGDLALRPAAREADRPRPRPRGGARPAGRRAAPLVVAGPATNVAYLRALAEHDEVRAGRLDTGLLERLGGELGPDRDPALPALALIALIGEPESDDPWDARDGWRPGEPGWARARLSGDDGDVQAAVRSDGAGWFEADGVRARLDGERLRVEAGGVIRRLDVIRDGAAVWLVGTASPRAGRSRATRPSGARCPARSRRPCPARCWTCARRPARRSRRATCCSCSSR